MYMSDEYKDYVIMACILHDTCKYGCEEFDKEQYKDHAKNASVNVANCWVEYFEEQAPVFFTNAIKTHMGQWSEKDDRPFTNIDRCVHMADYMASRSFIEIPQVSQEWFEVTYPQATKVCEDDCEGCPSCENGVCLLV
jgi:HD superfamily phosphohydrolase YqeK